VPIAEQNVRYEPFGERVETETKGAPQSCVSRTLARVGAGLFWILLAVIVTARAVYFQPWNFDGLQVVAMAKGLLGVF
jgi:hypothetical protein